MFRRFPVNLCCVLLLLLGAIARAQVVINEIHYHPVEISSFDASGSPIFSDTGLPADFTDDVHEFVEIRNAGPLPVDVSGWQLAGGIDFTLPASTTIAAGGYRVIAKNPARLQTVYGISGVLGPFTGSLSNRDDSVRLKDSVGNITDEVSYTSSFPWPTSADALGAADDFTLLTSASYQYKGRSLQRVSASAISNDPANWLASPLASGPTPGAANAVTLATPKPVVVGFVAVQAVDDEPVIRQGSSVRISCTFSSTVSLTGVEVEYFVDNINAFGEAKPTVAMTALGNSQFSATLPGQTDRSVVRYRIRANRGTGLEAVSPRADDAAIVPVGATTREAWHAYFVQPVRTGPNPIYDLFVSDDGTANNVTFNGLNGIQAMAYNVSGNPKRVTASANTGLPRDTPFVLASDRLWNGSVPAIFVENGTVRDAHFRLHGSRYNRSPTRPTYKLRFSDTQKFQDADSEFITDKSDYFSVMHGLYVNAGLPLSSTRWIDWYMNSTAKVTKLEQGEYNGDLLSKYHDRMAALNPGQPKEANGEFLKDVGTIEEAGEGPYGRGDERPLTAAGPWTAVQRYEWTYLLQNNGWKGSKPTKDFIEGLWTARGDTYTAPNPNVVTLRAYLDTVMDVDTELTSMAILNWGCPWDDTTQNHFLWRRANGRWAHFPWDFDSFFGNGDNTDAGSSIYLGEVGLPASYPGNNSRGPNFFKDSIFKAYRTEYNNRLWLLNNTYLHPDALKTLYFKNAAGTQQSYYSYINSVYGTFCEQRFASVNTQLGHAANGSDFLRPGKPVLAGPIGGVTALPPATFTASAYSHSSGSTSGGNAHAKSKWEIRTAAGDYLAPAFATTSPTNLTSFAIPFAELTFGQTYFWRVTYYDANDHPSLTSDESSFVFGPQSTSQTLIAFGDVWKYDYAGTFTDATWAQPAFNDAGWAGGPGTLAFENQASIPETIRTPLPDPRTLTPAGRAYYFRKHFNVPASPATLTNLRIRHLIDDGCVIWINGVKIHRYFMNEQATYSYSAFSNGNPGDGVYQFADAVSNTSIWSWIDPRPYLVQGDNVIAVEVHQTNGTSSDITFGLEMTATIPATPGDIVINEVLANGPSGGDWIELRNTTGAAINISGFGLTDDILNPTRYVFPAGTVIAAAGRLVISCSGDLPVSANNTGFGLDSGGQRIVLTSAGIIRDYVTFGPQARGYTIGRMPDGTGAFTLTTPTLNATNVAVATLGSVTNLRINEWMASPAHGDDWFELYNTDANPVALAGLWLSDTSGTPQITQIPPLSYIAGKGYADFLADGSNGGGNHANFKLSAGGDNLLLTNGATTVDAVAVTGVLTNTSRGRLPDGAVTLQNFPLTDSLGESNWKPAPIVINEAFTRSTPPAEDAIELFNPTASPVNIGGWWLSDDRRNRRKYQISAGTIIPAGGYLVFTETQFGAGAIPFQLDATGEDAVLTEVDGGGLETGLRAQVSFGVAAEGVSFGRVLTGSPAGMWQPEFWPQAARTLGSANAAPVVTPVIINEIHYHPPDVGGADNVRDEFVELHNPTTSPVALGGWRLKGGSDFTFTAGTTLRPGDYILVVGFDPIAAPATLAAFRGAFSVPSSVPIYGPFTPKLTNDEASLEIACPDPVLPLFFNVDKVRYADFAPWPTGPDGGGTSLQRSSRTLIGNDPANWLAAVPTPGSVNAGQSPILDSDGDGLPDAWEIANGLDRFNAADAALDSDADGRTNTAEYLAGTDPKNAASNLTVYATKPAGSGSIIHFIARAGRGYTIQWRADLAAGSWQKLTDIAAPASDTPVDYSDSTADPRRFYRVVTPATP